MTYCIKLDTTSRKESGRSTLDCTVNQSFPSTDVKKKSLRRFLKGS